MKCISFVFSFFLAVSVFGQGFYIDAGIKGQYGGNSLLNSAIVDHPDWQYDLTTGYSFGGKVGFNFEDHGITVDVMFSNGEASFETDGGASNLITSWSSTDLYLLYRLSRFRGYLEVGPKASFYGDFENLYPDGDVEVVSPFFNDNSYSGVLGFGTYLLGTDGRFSGIFGLRFEYGISDAVNSTAARELGYPVRTPDLYANGYTSTVPFFAGIVFELNWGIGYYGKASCGARGKFIFL